MALAITGRATQARGNCGGGDLDQWLWPSRAEQHKQEGTGTVIFLTWNKRKEVAQGIATGLNYLHKGLPNSQIFHLDIKPRNILLDENFTPKIADFGISQLYEPGYTKRIRGVEGGSYGYMAPEVSEGSWPTSKMDVYSFGVVLMQLVSGRKINDDRHQSLKISFLQWARSLVEGGHIDDIIDMHLLESMQPGFEVKLRENCCLMIGVVVRCTEHNPGDRPEMDTIMIQLENFHEVQELDLLTLDESLSLPLLPASLEVVQVSSSLRNEDGSLTWGPCSALGHC